MEQKIDLYTICWNEEYMLPYFFRHYDKFVDRYIVFDDGSTDDSLRILSEHPKVEVREFPRRESDSYIISANELHNNCWKESTGNADWVITTAIDEFLYTNNLDFYLRGCADKGVTIIPALGYQMICEYLPREDEDLIELVTRGCSWLKMNKLSVFNPNKITNTNQEIGRHSAKPEGDISYPEKDELLNLHYKYLSFDATYRRHCDLHEKLGEVDKANNWGHKYSWSMREFEKDWIRFSSQSVEDVLNVPSPAKSHSPLNDRWWRKNQKISLIKKIMNR